MTRMLHIFQCGGADLYGLTHDPAGANLPPDSCAGGWRLLKSLDWEGKANPWGFDVRWQEAQSAVAAGLALNGFFLSERATLPDIFHAP